MARTRVPRALPTAAVSVTAMVLTTLLTGCGAGNNAATAVPYAPSDGALANSGEIRILNALVVAADGSSTGVVSTTIVNRGESGDELTGITSPQGTVELSGAATLDPGAALPLGSGTDVTATVTGLTAGLGETITLRLEFARTEPLSLRTLVVEAAGAYASITPAPAG